MKPYLILLLTLILYNHSSIYALRTDSLSVRWGNIMEANVGRSTLRVTGDIDYVPFEFNNDRGHVSGFNVDIFRAVAKEMDLNAEIQLKEWSKARLDLMEGHTDMLLGMFKTAGRDTLFDFSTPFFIDSYFIFIRKGDKKINAITLKEKEVIVPIDGIAYDLMVESKMSNDFIIANTVEEVITRLSVGEGDCAVISRLQAEYYIRQKGIKNLKVSGSSLWETEYCMVVPEGHATLLAELNVGLSIIKANGIYDKIYSQWFGSNQVWGARYRSSQLKWLLWSIVVLIALSLIIIVWFDILRREVEKRTLTLNMELKERRRIQFELADSERYLRRKNEEYDKLNSALLEKNEKIFKIHSQLESAFIRTKENEHLKNAFLANMSHEIRTPMNGIIGYAELLRTECVDKEGEAELLKIIMESGQQLSNIINGILEMSKIESKRDDLDINEINVNDLFNNLHQYFSPKALSKDVQLILSGDCLNQRFPVWTDYEKLYKVLYNLLLNALKYTHEGYVRFGCILQQEWIEFFVEDSGIGVAKKDHSLIFKGFGKVDGKIGTDSARGIGLGLSISKSLVEQLGGSLRLKSEEGKGARFYFNLPLKHEDKLDETIN